MAPEPSASSVAASTSGPSPSSTWASGWTPVVADPARPGRRSGRGRGSRAGGRARATRPARSRRSPVDRVGRQVRPLRLDPEVRLRRSVRGEHAGVVARAVDRRPSSPARRASGGPSTPWPIVPAKKMPGTVALSHHGVWTGSRLAPKVVDPEVGQVDAAGDTKPVAEIASSTSMREVGAAVGPSQVDGQPPVGRPLDPVDRRVEDADPAAQDVSPRTAGRSGRGRRPASCVSTDSRDLRRRRRG